MTTNNNDFNWSDDQWQRVRMVVHDEAARARTVRKVLPLFGNSEGYVNSIVGGIVGVVPGTVRVIAGAVGCECTGQIDRARRLSAASLLIDDCDDSHDPPPQGVLASRYGPGSRCDRQRWNVNGSAKAS